MPCTTKKKTKNKQKNNTQKKDKKQTKEKNKKNKNKTKQYDDTSLKCIASLCEKDSYNSKIASC